MPLIHSGKEELGLNRNPQVDVDSLQSARHLLWTGDGWLVSVQHCDSIFHCVVYDILHLNTTPEHSHCYSQSHTIKNNNVFQSLAWKISNIEEVWPNRSEYQKSTYKPSASALGQNSWNTCWPRALTGAEYGKSIRVCACIYHRKLDVNAQYLCSFAKFLLKIGLVTVTASD